VGDAPEELEQARAELVAYGRRLVEDGLALGSAGNLSVRVGGLLLVTPAGVGGDRLEPRELALVSLGDGSPLSGRVPSSELPLHLALYRARRVGAVVHTHSPEVVALSATRRELPAIHYSIVALGGPVRVARYARFGSERLAGAALEALEDREAVILENHGAVTIGRTLEEAFERALLLEWLAGVHRRAVALGAPRLLSAEELAEVEEEVARRRRAARVARAARAADGVTR
jgi:L-fuculose-phosphate aldolase